ncbi:outer membrane protein a precursor [hydrocarbon metagenome]|uniref:Outer membrane protein a n=1 Tax=hydrocarbon metagenome TaxID=938273 RepID=A0A0W8FR43_9ZZZZ
MKTLQYFIIVTFVTFLTGCATMAPNELVNARSAYQNASEGPAAQLAPAELHKAHEALVLAEESFQKDSDSYKTKDLAYAAQRKSEKAGALGAMAADKARKDMANADFQKKQTEIVKQGKQDLSDSKKQTAEAQAEIDKQAALREAKEKSDAKFQMQQAEIAKQTKQALSDSEKRTADALAALASLAAVKEEERGLVVTLSGSVLFRSAKSTLLPSAQVKLDQVANALLAVSARNLIVEGHTDSRGSESYNQNLSQRRADTVRDYLVQRGYPSEHIQARGMGEGRPIADNASPEGRANNRRVEIVIER